MTYGKFDSTNNYRFSGTFGWPAGLASNGSVTVYVQEQVWWGVSQNVAAPAGPNSYGPITRPPACPTPTITYTCNGVNTGTVKVVLTVADSTLRNVLVQIDGGSNQTESVSSATDLAGRTFTFTGVGNGAHTISVTPANGPKVDYALTTNSAPGTPGTPTLGVVCSAGAATGAVTATFSSTAGQVASAYTVSALSGSAATPNAFNIAAGGGAQVVTFSPAIASGNYTLNYTVNGAAKTFAVGVACTPGTPAATPAVECTAGAATGKVAVTFTVTGGQVSSTFVITSPTSNPTPTPVAVVVAPGGSAAVVFAGAPAGTFVVQYTVNGGQAQTLTIPLNCVPGTATAVPTVVCANFDGVVTITFTHTGGDLAVVYVVDGTADTVSKATPTTTVVIANVPDGTFTKAFTKNGDPDSVSITVDCDPELIVTPICNEVDADNQIVKYFYTISNQETVVIPVAWADGNANVPASGSSTVSSGGNSIAVMYNGTTVATANASNEVCGKAAKFTKVLAGQAPAGETYTVRVSRPVGATYDEVLTFNIVPGVPQTFTLPSTLDPSGIVYRVEEIVSGTSSTQTVSPDSFTLQGNLGETVGVVVTNGFAAVQINKTVSATTVKGGEPLVYKLVAQNTGGLVLNPVVISDRRPMRRLSTTQRFSVPTSRRTRPRRNRRSMPTSSACGPSSCRPT